MFPPSLVRYREYKSLELKPIPFSQPTAPVLVSTAQRVLIATSLVATSVEQRENSAQKRNTSMTGELMI